MVAHLDHGRPWQAAFEALAHADRPGTRSATAMGRGESLVEVDVHHVEAHVTRAADAEHRVEVGPVVVHESATAVHEACDLRDLTFEETERVGVGHHHCRHVRSEERLEVIDIDAALRRAFHLDHLEAANGGRGGVGAVGRVGHDDLTAGRVTTFLMIGADDHQSCQLTMRTGAWVESEVGHARDGSQSLPEVILDGEGALRGAVWLQGMEVGKGRHVGNLLIDGRVVLHRTRAEGVEAVEHAEVVATVVGIMSHHCHLITFR